MNFDEWWNQDYDDKDNPFEKDSFGYWAFAGWCAQKQETQELVSLKVYQGEICYKSQHDDQSYGMWCPVESNSEHSFPEETKFYTSPPKEKGCAECGCKTAGYAKKIEQLIKERDELRKAPAHPKREWVGLTEEEMESIWNITPPEYQDRFAFAKAVEAKLKKKNTCR